MNDDPNLGAFDDNPAAPVGETTPLKAPENPTPVEEAYPAESSKGEATPDDGDSDDDESEQRAGNGVVSGAGPELAGRLVDALKSVYDPEIPVDIYELGLIYDVAVNDSGHVDCKMTLTSPGCPVAGTLPLEVQDKIETVDGIESAEVEVVWDPVWNPSMMSEAAKLELGFMDYE